MKRRIFRWVFGCCGLLFLVFILLPLLSYRLALVVWGLPFGWIGFLKRVLPNVTVNWSGIGMVIACSVIIVGGVQWLASWLYHHMSAPSGSDDRRWKWRWSLSTYAVVWLLFLAAMGLTGFVHQLGWLLSSKEPLMVVRQYRGELINGLRYQAMELTMAAEDSDWDLNRTRQKFFADQQPSSRLSPNALEDLEVLFIPGADSKLRVGILFYRDTVKRQKSGLVVAGRELQQADEHHDIEELPRILARYQSVTNAATHDNTGDGKEKVSR